MKPCIIDMAFPIAKQSSRGLAAQWLGWELKRRDITECDIGDADVLLLTCVSSSQSVSVRTLRNRYPGKVIICGGGYQY